MKLTAKVRENDLVVVAAAGTITRSELDVSPAHPFETALDAGWMKEKLLLNMQDVSFMDSAGIGWLLDVNRKCKSGGGKLVLYALQPRVRQMLELLKLDTVFAVAPNEAQARAAATKGDAAGEAKGEAK